VAANDNLVEPADKGHADFWALVRRAEKGDQSAMPELRKIMDGNSALVELIGDFAAQVEITLIENVGGKALAFKEAVKRKMRAMRADLAGANATPLERLLADRIALCWLAVHDAEVRFAQSKDLTWKQVEFWQRRIDAGHRRYLSAIKTLATVRKLAVPVLIGQLNIAAKQVNKVACPPMANGAEGHPTKPDTLPQSRAVE
jgi:hypothetical protein